MPVNRAFQLFDSLVSPVALYATEFWFPHSIAKKCFTSKEQLLSSWESMKGETINQSCSRIILSVHRKASRLAVLGELGRYPLAVKAISQCLNYRQCLTSKPADSLIGQVMGEMASLASQGKDCWLTRVNKMAELLQLPEISYSKNSGRAVTKIVRSCFDRYWLNHIQKSRASEFFETRPIDHVFIARWWSIAMCAPATSGLLKIKQRAQFRGFQLFLRKGYLERC